MGHTVPTIFDLLEVLEQNDFVEYLCDSDSKRLFCTSPGVNNCFIVKAPWQQQFEATANLDPIDLPIDPQ